MKPIILSPKTKDDIKISVSDQKYNFKTSIFILLLSLFISMPALTQVKVEKEKLEQSSTPKINPENERLLNEFNQKGETLVLPSEAKQIDQSKSDERVLLNDKYESILINKDHLQQRKSFELDDILNFSNSVQAHPKSENKTELERDKILISPPEGSNKNRISGEVLDMVIKDSPNNGPVQIKKSDLILKRDQPVQLLNQNYPSKKDDQMTVMETDMENYAPVATPDVYTTPENTELIIAAPGHLANDSDLNGDELIWISYTVPENGAISNASVDGGFSYTPNPGFSGIDNIEVAISDNNGGISFGLISILVIPDQNRNPVAVPDVFTTPENTALEITPPGHLSNDLEPDGDELTWLSYTVPENGTMSNTTSEGGFTYTPNPGFSGIESLEIAISDGNGGISFGLISILVIPEQNRTPIAVPDVYTTPENTPLIVSAPGHTNNDIDLDGDEIEWLSYTVPENGVISNPSPDGTFTYTPNPGFTGLESIEVAISDGNGGISFGLLQIQVISDQNRNPVAVPDTYTTPENTALIVSAPGHLGNDSDPDGDEIEWITYTVPENGFISNVNSDGTFTYTPNPGFTGIEEITVSISDGEGGIAFGLIMITVTPSGGTDPVAVADVFTTPENTALVVSPPGHLDNDFDPNGDPITWLSYSVPENGSITNTTSDGGFTYTPNPGFSGIETFEYAISDGNGGIGFGLISILVIPDQNREPIAIPDVFTTPENTPLIVSAPGHLGNDFDRDGDEIEWISYTVPENGTMSNTSSDGTFTYTPNPGFSGIESLEVAITDGNGGIAFTTLTILVIPDQNREPVAVPDVYTTPEGIPLIVSAPGHTNNDIDLDGDEIEWLSYTVPENGVISNPSPDGTFTYTPNPGFSGIESIEIAISDGNGGISFGLISILVIPDQNRTPIAVPDVYTTPENTELIVTAPGHLANDFDLDGDEIEWISYTVPENGSMSNTSADGGFTYTPNPDFKGIESLTIAITDGNGGIGFGQLIISVIPNNPPIADAGEDQEVIEQQTVNLDGSGSSDPEGDPITYSWMFASPDTSPAKPAGSTASLSGANTSTPSFIADVPGTYSVQLIVNDGFKDSDPDYVTITAILITEALNDLEDDIQLLTSSQVLNNGQENGLLKKIDQALKLLDKDKYEEALAVLYDLRTQVMDLYEKDNVLTEAQATALIASIDEIIAVIESKYSISSYQASSISSVMGISGNDLTDKNDRINIYPNPVKTTAEIVYRLEKESNVTIEMFNMTGQKVQVIKDGFSPAGNHQITLKPETIQSGIYHIFFTTDNGIQEMRKVMIIR
ncbi:Ig-like domain-containing protein [Mangrovivirga sp. M17]|uniref:Ig-like domain-containing protein n=1 Tax=Mangrovivirga halotolerans TaxID=2993936 RepID=A0ABT3RQR8_9BACT|nr:Ig-like domain-containing protein [Mangrovivirga halotolerans]MCX2743724.1 Ig-like domain-containing protein [Mangrovivirga halotolerans]